MINDPSTPYFCAPHGCLETSLGEFPKGVGSLDIIPDADSDPTIPVAFTRIYSDIPNAPSAVPPSLLPFGSTIREVIPAEWIAEQQAAPAEKRIVYIPGGSPAVRRSVGIRTLTPVTYSAKLIFEPGSEITAITGATLPANFTLLQSLEQFLGRPVLPSDDVRIVIESGNAIVFYSYTHNVTNEPTVMVAPPVETAAVLMPR
jgi:hypothetical protein